MGQALKDWARADPEPWKLSSNQAQASTFYFTKAPILKKVELGLGSNPSLNNIYNIMNIKYVLK